MVYMLTAEQVAPLPRQQVGYNKTQFAPVRYEEDNATQQHTYVGGTKDIVNPYRDRTKPISRGCNVGSGILAGESS